MKLADLAPGRRFRLPYCGKTGTLLQHGIMGARVSYGQPREVSFTPKAGDVELDKVEFVAPARAEIISMGTEVVPL